jgi:hypothetical protein
MATEGSKVIARGALAGVLSAIVMGIQWMVISGVNGAGFFTPLALIGATFTREAWMTSFAGSVVTGTLLHLFTGAALGALFAFLTRDMVESGNRFAAGIAYGATVFLVMTFLVLPWANPVLFYGVDKGVYFLVHLVYGAILPLAMTRRHVYVEGPTMHPHHPVRLR